MKTVILAGGKGTRLAEETSSRPKPMVEIGGKPILWHLMHIYASHGCSDFVVACGYKGEMIKDYFHDLLILSSDFTVDLTSGRLEVANGPRPDWRVSVVDTGLDTMTGGRIRRLQPWIGPEAFMATYGDGARQRRHHGAARLPPRPWPPGHGHGRASARPASAGSSSRTAWCASSPRSRRPKRAGSTAGSSCSSRACSTTSHGDDTILEREPLERLAAEGQLIAFQHDGFWQPMDTLREKQLLEALWSGGRAPWKVWP